MALPQELGRVRRDIKLISDPRSHSLLDTPVKVVRELRKAEVKVFDAIKRVKVKQEF